MVNFNLNSEDSYHPEDSYHDMSNIYIYIIRRPVSSVKEK